MKYSLLMLNKCTASKALTQSPCITYFPEGRLSSPQRESDTVTCSLAWA